MKIKMKMKHLLIGILSFAVLLLGIQVLVLPLWKEHLVTKAYTVGAPKTGEMIKSLIDDSWSDKKKLGFIETYMIEPTINVHIYDLYLTSSSSTWSHEGSWRGFEAEEIQPYLTYYVDKGNPHKFYYDYAVAMRAEHIAKTDSVDDAIVYVEKQIKEISTKRDYVESKLTLLLAELYKRSGDLDHALVLLDEIRDQEKERLQEFVEEYVLSEDWTLLKAKILLEKNNVKEAISTLSEWEESQKLLAQRDEWIEYYDDNRITRLKERLLAVGEVFEYGTVSGFVQKEDGTPIVGTAVMLRDQSRANYSVDPYGEDYQTVTDEQGYYEVTGVLPGEYQIGLGLSFNQISGYSWPVEIEDSISVENDSKAVYDVELRKLMNVVSPVNNQAIDTETILFEWEETTAAYYLVYAAYHFEHGSVSMQISEEIQEHSWEARIEDLHHIGFFVDYDVRDEENYEGAFAPGQLFDFIHPAGKFSWSVAAYDENGKEIRRSNGYRLDDALVEELPFFTLTNREPSKGDQLLLDGKHQQALEAYRTLIKENKEDDLSLRMAVKLINGLRQQKVGNDEKLREEMYGYIAQLSTLTEKPFYAEMMMDKAEKEDNQIEYDKWKKIYDEHQGG